MANDPLSNDSLRRDAIGVWHIVFFVMAAAAPLAVVVGVTPYAFAFGNGTGVPLTFLVVGGMYVLFSVGFTAMSAHIGRAVSFYPYIAAGLGKPVAVGGAFASITTYLSVQLMATALFGVFANTFLQKWLGVDCAWWICCLALQLASFLTGRRGIELSGRVLAVLMVAEVAILLLLGFAVLLQGGGPEGISISPFSVSSLMTGNLGVALVFIVSAFIGFEATAIFGEEARDPRRTIPLATFLAVSLIAVFYAFSTWIIALNYGPSNIVEVATGNFTGLYQVAIESRLGKLFGTALEILMITSLFACVLSFHNTINRYFYVISREGLVHRMLSATHAKHQSPHHAGLFQLALMATVLVLLGLSPLDPVAIVGWASGFTAIGILMIQILVSLSVIFFFNADNRGTSVWHRMLAPGSSIICLAVCLYLLVINIEYVSGTSSPLVKAFPVVILLIIAFGAARGVWLKSARPEIYKKLGSILN